MTDRQYGCACFLRGRSILSSNCRTVTCRSSACSFSAPTVSINQDARVAVTVRSSASRQSSIRTPQAVRRE